MKMATRFNVPRLVVLVAAMMFTLLSCQNEGQDPRFSVGSDVIYVEGDCEVCTSGECPDVVCTSGECPDVVCPGGDCPDVTCPTGECPDVECPDDDVTEPGPDTIEPDDVMCVPDCMGKDCGPDGCGGTCGACQYGFICDANGSCEALPGCGDGVCQAPENCSNCHSDCGDCPVCEPDCMGKTCGDDGCGGECGNCAQGEYCDGTKNCVAIPPTCGDGICAGTEECNNCPFDCGACECVPSCNGKTCGDDGCGGFCGDEPNGTCPDGLVCISTNCIPFPSCGTGVCQEDKGENCGTCPMDCGLCPCEPSCDDKQCGTDGCGGNCGTCNPGAFCDYAGNCISVTPTECGDGECNGAETCTTCETDCGQCPCVPACEGKDCGDDGCGGDCGECPPGSTCNLVQACQLPPADCGNGACDLDEDCVTCPADCGECFECGDGVCNGAETCTTCGADCGVCPCVPACEGMNCGDDGCGGFCGVLDGECQEGFECDLDQTCKEIPISCPNGVCEAGLGENCAICPSDCGVCADPEVCNDGLDNDLDELTDAADPECLDQTVGTINFSYPFGGRLIAKALDSGATLDDTMLCSDENPCPPGWTDPIDIWGSDGIVRVWSKAMVFQISATPGKFYVWAPCAPPGENFTFPSELPVGSFESFQMTLPTDAWTCFMYVPAGVVDPLKPPQVP